MNAKIDLTGAAKILIASAAGYIATVWLDSLTGPTLLKLPLDAIIFAGVYLTSAPLLGALGDADLRRLHTAAEGFGRIRAPLKAIIFYEEAVTRLVHRGRQATEAQAGSPG
jgi:hypothetical protein